MLAAVGHSSQENEGIMYSSPDRIGQLARDHHHEMLAAARQRQPRPERSRPPPPPPAPPPASPPPPAAWSPPSPRAPRLPPRPPPARRYPHPPQLGRPRLTACVHDRTAAASRLRVPADRRRGRHDQLRLPRIGAAPAAPARLSRESPHVAPRRPPPGRTPHGRSSRPARLRGLRQARPGRRRARLRQAVHGPRPGRAHAPARLFPELG